MRRALAVGHGTTPSTTPPDPAPLRSRAADFTTESAVARFAVLLAELGLAVRRPSNLIPEASRAMIRTLAAGASRRLARAIPVSSRIAWRSPGRWWPLPSMIFPSPPRENAAPALEDNAMAGTFYFADGLAGRNLKTVN